MARDEFSKRTKTVLRERVGGLCSRPECGATTVQPDLLNRDSVYVTGRAAHIEAASSGGPRYNPLMTDRERRAIENGIWLCSDCADMVDKDSGAAFDVLTLRSWKTAAERKQSNKALFSGKLKQPAWLELISSPYYVNVPRLLHILGEGAIGPKTREAILDGFPDRSIVRELLEVENVIRRSSLHAFDIDEIVDPFKDLREGMIISFYRQCRTRNGRNLDPKFVEFFDWDKSPLIYLNKLGYRFVFPLDPRFFTTKTGQGTCMAGNVKLAGLAIVKSIDRKNKMVVASPLVFGIPNLFGI